MVTSLCVTSGRRSASWERVSRRVWAVHHVGRRAVRFIAPDGSVATVTAPGAGLSPMGVEMATPADFARVAETAAGSTGWVTLAADTETDLVDLRLTAGSTEVVALGALGGPLEAWRSGLEAEHARLHDVGAALAGALEARAPIDRLVLALVGAGPGATPAGDDILVGIIAALVRRGRVALVGRLAAVVHPLSNRTTAVSRTLLEAAADHEFATYVHTLVHAAADLRLAPSALTELAAVGASSGFDTALGFCSASVRHHRKSAA